MSQFQQVLDPAAGSLALSALVAAIPLTSPPAQKPLPTPVSTMHLTLGSRAATANWRASA